MKRMFLFCSAASLAFACLILATAGAQPPGKSDTKVKATAVATVPGKDGKQTVTITLDIEKGWYIYANPVGWKRLEDNNTVVTLASKEKLTAAVKYPEGIIKTTTDEKQKPVQYRAYEGRVVIQAQIQRAVGDDSPLQVTIDVNACDKNTCLLSGVVKLTVPGGK